MKIWCVEDDPSILDIEVYALKAAGYEAAGFSDSEEFFEALKKELPELIILDVMLPGKNGVELLKCLRARAETGAIPIIMATAKGAEYDKVQSLDLGADDYLVKPFGMLEMVSRVKAVLRRYKPDCSGHLLKAENLELNLDKHIVTVNGERILLTFKEFELLKLFLSHPGMVFTREQLFGYVWGEEYAGETRTVDMHIWTLRQKLGGYGKMIETVRNVGYRMEVPGR